MMINQELVKEGVKKYKGKGGYSAGLPAINHALQDVRPHFIIDLVYSLQVLGAESF